MRVKGNELEQIKSQIDLRTIIPLSQSRPYTRYIAGLCPFHEADGGRHKTPSFMLYSDHYNCLSPACGEHGDIFNWVSFQLFGDARTPLRSGKFGEVKDYVIERYLGQKNHVVKAEPVKRKKTKLSLTEQEKLDDLARLYHRNLLSNPTRLAYFYSRGFTHETIKREMWGWDGSNYVITVWRGTPRKSRLVTLRLRASDKNSPMRYSGIKDINDQILYNRDALLWCIRNDAPVIVVVYGEFDARYAWQDGIPAVSPTNGALSFLPKWLNGYSGDVVFLPDKGEEKAAYNDANAFGTRGSVAHFPEGKFKDYSDFRNAGHSAKEMIGIIRRAAGHPLLLRRWKT